MDARDNNILSKFSHVDDLDNYYKQDLVDHGGNGTLHEEYDQQAPNVEYLPHACTVRGNCATAQLTGTGNQKLCATNNLLMFQAPFENLDDNDKELIALLEDLRENKDLVENYCSIKRCTAGSTKRLVKNRKGNYSTTNIQAI